MKILNVNCTLSTEKGGGTAERTYQMSQFLSKNSQECTVLTLDIELSLERKESFKKTKLIALKPLFRRYFIPKFNIFKMKKLIQETDLIHIMGHWALINAVVYIYARLLKKTYVVCPAGSMPIFGRSKKFKFLFNLLIGKAIIKNAVWRIAITEDEVSLFEKYTGHKKNILVIPNGVNKDEYQSRNDQAFRDHFNLPQRPIILYVGRLNSIKGVDLLLEGFIKTKEKIKDYILVFAGPDEGMKTQLEATAKAHQVSDSVFYIGYVGAELKSQAYHASEILAIPSRSEAMSIVVLEAGVIGKPVLLTDQCGLNNLEALRAAVVVAANADSIGEGLVQILTKEDRILLGENLKKYTTENFSWDIITQQYIELYQKILD